MGAVKKTIFAAITESVSGTLETDGAGDALTITDLKLSPKLEQVKRSVMRGSLTQLPALPGKQTASFEVTCELRGSGTHAVAPEFAPLLESAFGVQRTAVGGLVSGAKTTSTTIFSVSGTSLADEDDILIQVGATYLKKHISDLTENTVDETITISVALAQAPTNGTPVVKYVSNGTVAASPPPTTTTFDLTGGTLQEDDEILVEIGSAYESTVVTSVTPGSGVQSIVVSPALSLAPSTGANVVVNTLAGTVVVTAAPTTTVFTVMDDGSPVVDLAIGDPILVDISATATPSWSLALVTAVTDGDLRQTVTVTPTLGAAPTAGHEVVGSIAYKLTSDDTVRSTFSAYAYLDGDVKFSFAGCLATFKMTDFAVGNIPKLVFQVESIAWTVSDTACAYTPTNDVTLKPPIVLGASLTLGGAETYVRNVELDLGQKITRREAIQATSGTRSMAVTERLVTGSIDPYQDDSAQFSAWQAMTTAELRIKLADKLAAPNLIALRMPEITRTDVTLEDADGVWANKIPFDCGGSDDQEVVLGFIKTPA